MDMYAIVIRELNLNPNEMSMIITKCSDIEVLKYQFLTRRRHVDRNIVTILINIHIAQ